MLRMTRFIDIDNVISDDEWRIHAINFKQTGDARYHDYHLMSAFDKYVPLPSALIDFGDNIVFVTAMPEQYRAMRRTWLNLHRIPWNALLMRPVGDHRHSAQLKREMVTAYMVANKLTAANVAAAIDDRHEVVDMYIALGLPGFRHQLHDVRYDVPPTKFKEVA